MTTLEKLSAFTIYGLLIFPGAPVQVMHKCLAASLPECDFSALSGGSEKYIYRLVKTTKEIKIETTLKQG